jgi:tetratricopeptide (TPR) repeat protein
MPAFLKFAFALALLGGSAPALSLAGQAQGGTPETLYNQARAAEAAGDLKTAQAKYEQIVSLRPDLAEAYANLGRLYYQQQQSAQAVRCLEKAIKLKPGLAGPYFFLGLIAFDSRNYDEALKYLKRAEALDSSQAVTALYLGYTNYALRNYLEAVRDFQKVAKVQQDDQNVLYYLSTSYGQAAKHFYGVLRQNFPESFYTHLVRAHAFETMGNWQDAKAEYTSALAQQPQSARLKQRLDWATQNAAGKPAGPPPSRASDSQGQLIDGSLQFLYVPLEEADVPSELKRYESLIESESGALPDKKLYSLGENYQILSYLTSLRVIKVAPDSYRAHQLKARFYAEMGQFQEAFKEYRVAEDLKPDLPDLHFEIGDLYWGRDEVEQALPELQRELSIQPNHPQALYEVGDIMFAEGKLQESEQYLLKALKVEPGMVAAHLALERIYTQLGKYPQSMVELQSAIKSAPNDPRPHYRMAMVLRKMGKHEQAQQELAIFASMRSRVGFKEAGSATAGEEGKP